VEGADPRRPGWARGTSCRYVPVAFRGYAPAVMRQRVPVRAVAVEEGIIRGDAEVEQSAYPLPSGLSSPLSSVNHGRHALPVL
jgi:hypothetical protein